ncbi:hypothetical protein KFE98_01370 [bacterium SCSIO 12741]|nr:hypothetical protein KFE98_01370 [bacterium SCSIO 12741]
MEPSIAPTKSPKKWIRIAIALSLLNATYFILFNENGGFNSKGEYVPFSVEQNIRSALSVFVLFLPLLSLLLGALFASLPFGQLTYEKRFKKVFWWALILLNFMAFCGQMVGSFFEKIVYEPRREEGVEKLDQFKDQFDRKMNHGETILDSAWAELQRGADPGSVSAKYGLPLLRVELAIDSLMKDLYLNQREYGVHPDDFNRLMDEINREPGESSVKYQRCVEAGFEMPVLE